MNDLNALKRRLIVALGMAAGGILGFIVAIWMIVQWWL
jgi:hypothetical protein